MSFFSIRELICLGHSSYDQLCFLLSVFNYRYCIFVYKQAIPLGTYCFYVFVSITFACVLECLFQKR